MIKITDQEMERINTLRSAITTTAQETGQLSLEIYLLEDSLKTTKLNVERKLVEFKSLLQEEELLVDQLREQYGDGLISFETGEFTPN